MFFVVVVLNFATTVCFAYCTFHAVGDDVGVHYHPSFAVACSTSYCLNKRSVATQKAFLVGVQNGDKFHLRHVQSFTQKVDSHQHVELAFFQSAYNFNTLQRVYFRVHVTHPDVLLCKEVCQTFCHTFGQSCYQNPSAAVYNGMYFAQQIVYLSFHGTHLHHWVQKPRRANELLHHVVGTTQFVLRRGCGYTNQLSQTGVEFVKG